MTLLSTLVVDFDIINFDQKVHFIGLVTLNCDFETLEFYSFVTYLTLQMSKIIINHMALN